MLETEIISWKKRAKFLFLRENQNDLEHFQMLLCPKREPQLYLRSIPVSQHALSKVKQRVEVTGK